MASLVLPNNTTMHARVYLFRRGARSSFSKLPLSSQPGGTVGSCMHRLAIVIFVGHVHHIRSCPVAQPGGAVGSFGHHLAIVVNVRHVCFERFLCRPSGHRCRRTQGALALRFESNVPYVNDDGYMAARGTHGATRLNEGESLEEAHESYVDDGGQMVDTGTHGATLLNQQGSSEECALRRKGVGPSMVGSSCCWGKRSEAKTALALAKRMFLSFYPGKERRDLLSRQRETSFPFVHQTCYSADLSGKLVVHHCLYYLRTLGLD